MSHRAGLQTPITSCIGCGRQLHHFDDGLFSKRLTLAPMCSTSFIQSRSICCFPAPAACSGPARATSCSVLPRLRSRSSTLTCTEKELGYRRCHARKLILLTASRSRTRSRSPQSPHRVPAPLSDLRNSDCVPASARPHDQSSHGLRASSDRLSATTRTLHPTASVYSKVQNPVGPGFVSRHASCSANQACKSIPDRILHSSRSFPRLRTSPFSYGYGDSYRFGIEHPYPKISTFLLMTGSLRLWLWTDVRQTNSA